MFQFKEKPQGPTSLHFQYTLRKEPYTYIYIHTTTTRKFQTLEKPIDLETISLPPPNLRDKYKKPRPPAALLCSSSAHQTYCFRLAEKYDAKFARREREKSNLENAIPGYPISRATPENSLCARQSRGDACRCSICSSREPSYIHIYR